RRYAGGSGAPSTADLAFDLPRTDLLDAPRQLVATPSTLTPVVLQIRGFERQGTLARGQHQAGALGQYCQPDDELLPTLHPRRGDRQYLVALALGQLRQVLQREHQQASLVGDGHHLIAAQTADRQRRQHPPTLGQAQQRLAVLVARL